jgi:hypothetical protein
MLSQAKAGMDKAGTAELALTVPEMDVPLY